MTLHRLQLHYELGCEPTGAQLHNPLIALLQAVSDQGSISGAARALGLSYRHVWGELKRWEQALGDDLLIWEKGQSARLSPFGTKLMWAERQAQARLAPQIEALHAELERCYALAFDPDAHVLTLLASHDEILAALRAHLAHHDGNNGVRLHLDVRYMGSIDALRALNEGRCGLAVLHTLVDADAHSLTARTCKRLLKPGQHKVIGLAQRWHGLMVPPANPLGLHSLADVARRGARLARREPGSANHLILAELSARAHLPEWPAHAPPEPSQRAVAQAVASGAADAALGVQTTAAQAGLDFVPLAPAQTQLICLRDAIDTAAVRALRAALTSADWLQTLGTLPGAQPLDSGVVRPLSRVLPWWHFAPKRQQPAPVNRQSGHAPDPG